ncbi:MAG: hypothetical protein GY778_28550 [bacterium]|nr:hypothetical protein [bacterium]
MVLVLAVGVAGLVAYLPQCRYQLAYDDIFIVARNPSVTGGTWSDCLTKPYWPKGAGWDALYRPMTTASFRLNRLLMGAGAAGFRVTNALLHAICSGLVVWLAWRTALLHRDRQDQPGNLAIGWLAGLIFAVHPLHADAVAAVVGRSELLAAMFVLLLIGRHLGYLAGHRRTSVSYHLITAVLFLLALGSKEHAVFALPAIPALDLWARPKGTTGAGLRAAVDRLAKSHYLGLVIALVLFLFARWLIFGSRTTVPEALVNPLANPLLGASSTTLLATPPALLSLAAGLFLIPIKLCPIWGVGGWDLPQTVWRLDVLIGVLLLAGWVVSVFWGLRRRRPAGLVLGWAGLFLVLPCHFVPAANWLFAERWLYLPSAFLAITLAGLLADLPRIRVTMGVVLLAVVGLFGLNWKYQQCWRGNAELFDAVVARHPDSYHGLIGLAAAADVRGNVLSIASEIDRLTDLYPDSPRSWYYRVLLMDRLGRPAETLAAYNQYIQVRGPNLPTRDLLEVRNRAHRLLADSQPAGP